jgi:flagellar assembly protein FliH
MADEIKSFSFSEIGKATASTATGFQFLNLDHNIQNSEHQKIIRQERQDETNNSFKIDKIVRELRGLSRQEQDDLERKISLEVEARVQKIKADAYQEGIEKGQALGEEKALSQALVKHQDQIKEMQAILENVKEQSSHLLVQHQEQVYETLKRTLKWLVIKEIQDKNYLSALLEKLILEMNQQHNLILRVGKNIVSQMPQVVKEIEAKLGTMTNVRIELDQSQVHPGIVLETENGILDGSCEGLFQTIDKMFEGVMNHESNPQS